MRRTTIWFMLLAAAVAMAVGMTPGARSSFADFERRVEAGDPEAMYRMSAILEKGFDSISADTLRSVELLRRAARAGYPPAMNYLGFLHQSGNILPANPDSAFYWISRAADAGDPKASHNLAYLLIDRPAPDYEKAILYLRNAADAGLPQAMTLLGTLYAEGRGLPADTLRAQALFEEAIDHGFADAEVRLLNLRGHEWVMLSSEQLLPLAVEYWKRGADTIAAELLLHVAPDTPQTPRAYALLGYAYSRGLGLPYDHHRANEYFARAALLGDPSAQFILAESLEIFPDLLQTLNLPPTDPESGAIHSITPESLRQSAAEAGIHTPEEAMQALLR